MTNYDGVLKVVSPNTETFQPNLEAFEELLTEKTKAVIVNYAESIPPAWFILRRP